MSTYNSRLFNKSRFERLVSITDDLANNGTEFSDLLAQYEDAEDADEREDIRDQAWSLGQEILADADRFRVELLKLEES
jgi:hypothetical protein